MSALPTFVCKTCGKETRRTSNCQKYCYDCSPHKRQIAGKAKVGKCEKCGASFDPTSNRQKWCSDCVVLKTWWRPSKGTRNNHLKKTRRCARCGSVLKGNRKIRNGSGSTDNLCKVCRMHTETQKRIKREKKKNHIIAVAARDYPEDFPPVLDMRFLQGTKWWRAGYIDNDIGVFEFFYDGFSWQIPKLTTPSSFLKNPVIGRPYHAEATERIREIRDKHHSMHLKWFADIQAIIWKERCKADRSKERTNDEWLKKRSVINATKKQSLDFFNAIGMACAIKQKVG